MLTHLVVSRVLCTRLRARGALTMIMIAAAAMENRRDEELAFQPIGNLMPNIVTSASSSVASPKPSSPHNSVTTGSPSQVSVGLKPIGQLSTATGAAGPQTTLPALLASTNPAATDTWIAASLPPSIASTLRPVTEETVDPVYGWSGELVRYEVPATSSPDWWQAREIVGAALVPADVQTIRVELARLRVSTKARDIPDGDLAMTLQVLAEECAEWPPDIVRAALRRWARREVWFPSLAELRDELQRVGRRRRLLALAFRLEVPP